MNRRSFLSWLRRIGKGAALGLVGLTGSRRLARGFAAGEAAPPAQQPIRPPGALPEPDFRAACTRCFLCGEV